jgi:hypothetical protein
MDVSPREQGMEVVKKVVEHFEPMVANIFARAKSI